MMLKTSAGFTGRAVTRTSTSPAAHLGTGACSHFSVLVGSAGLKAVTTTRCMVGRRDVVGKRWGGSERERTAGHRAAPRVVPPPHARSCTGFGNERRAPAPSRACCCRSVLRSRDRAPCEHARYAARRQAWSGARRRAAPRALPADAPLSLLAVFSSTTAAVCRALPLRRRSLARRSGALCRAALRCDERRRFLAKRAGAPL